MDFGTMRIRFGEWTASDLDRARALWGDPSVSRYICASGVFTQEEVLRRLDKEIGNFARFGVQYWPIFARADGAFLGCCGLRPGESADVYELGSHLLPAYWGKGLAREASSAAIGYAFARLGARAVCAGHHPDNAASGRALTALGFVRTGEKFYPATGINHPAYQLDRGERLGALDAVPDDALRFFHRHQAVTRCLRKEGGAYVERDIAFTEEWDEGALAKTARELSDTIARGGWVCAARLGGRIAGFAALEPKRFGPESEYVQLSELQVSNESRGAGLGRKLFEAACDEARARGAGKLYISAHSSVESQAFYRAMGCREAAHYDARLTALEPCDCQMEKEIEPSH